MIIIIIILTKRTYYYNTFFEKKKKKCVNSKRCFLEQKLRLNLFGTPVPLIMTLSGSYVTFWIEELKKNGF